MTPTGVPTGDDDASCIIFETLAEAEAFCRARTNHNPSLRFDILDAAGLLRPPLFTIVHPSRTAALEGSDTKRRRNIYVAIALLVVGPPLIWYDWAFHEGVLVMPTILGINALLIAVRLLIINVAHTSAEQQRRQRVRDALANERREP